MPPVRTLATAKPIKTERTHEENQERAYIAASRRSDRSLEARVESARRASEIHKRRTGRSLRVTEQDVVNEEMYEEEDDDLPLQYRRLTAHLQTGSTDFNRRLAAYLTNQVAVRSALDQAINTSYAQQYPHAPQFAHNQQPYPSPMLPPHMMHRSPTGYRTSPYPFPNAQQAFRPQAHQRSASMASPSEMQNYQSGFVSPGASPVDGHDNRRMSMPLGQGSHSVPPTPLPQNSTPNPQSPSASRNEPGAEGAQQQSTPHAFFKPEAQDDAVNQKHANMQRQFWPLSMPFDPAAIGNIAPFSTSLPTESQLMLGQALDPSDPFTSMLMGGNERAQQPFYSYNPNGPAKGSKANANSAPHPSYDGMNQTLAPGALETAGLDGHNNWSAPQSAVTDSVISPFTSGFGFHLDGSDGFKPNLTRSNSVGPGSAAVTPGDNNWTSLLDGNFFEEATSSQ